MKIEACLGIPYPVKSKPRALQNSIMVVLRPALDGGTVFTVPWAAIGLPIGRRAEYTKPERTRSWHI